MEKVINTLKSLLEKGAILLDVRTCHEYSGYHPDGALNVPYEEIDNRIHQIKSWKKVIITFSKYGRRSAMAVAKLKRKGIAAIDGGAQENIDAALGKLDQGDQPLDQGS